jgi:hypothetical protein
MQYGAANNAVNAVTTLLVTQSLQNDPVLMLRGNNNGLIVITEQADATGAISPVGTAIRGSGQVGVEGESWGPRKPSIGVRGSSPDTGVRGTSLQSQTDAGVHGRSGPASVDGTGVIGEAGTTNSLHGDTGSGSNAFGVWGKSKTGFAGFFSGKVHVSGILTKGGGGFTVDHLSDPENKTISHSYVEAPQPLNIYSGIVTTDTDGTATVQLPDYFEDLNRDFRYQLTVIGDFAQAVVAEEVHANAFTVRTDRPEVRVSWQVTGVRDDPFTRAYGLPVVADKPEEERGSYLHPELYGKPESQGVNFARGKESALEQPEEGRLT